MDSRIRKTIKQREAERRAALAYSGLWEKTPTSEVKTLIANLAKHYDCNASYYCLDDGQRVKVVSSTNVWEEYYDYDQTTALKYREIVGRTIPIIISDARKNELECDSPYVISGEVRFMAYIPFYSSQGYYFGSVGIDDPSPRYAFKLHDADFLVDTALELQSLLDV